MSQKSKVKSAGIAALPIILILGGLIGEIVIAATLSSYLLINAQFGIRLSNEAFLASQAGIKDALLRVTRDKNFSSVLYVLAVNNASADVTVCKDICVGAGKDQIISIGKSQSRNRKLEAIAAIDSVTGEVRLESLKELEL